MVRIIKYILLLAAFCYGSYFEKLVKVDTLGVFTDTLVITVDAADTVSVTTIDTIYTRNADTVTVKTADTSSVKIIDTARVFITDVNGRRAGIDGATWALNIIDYEHHEIHSGSHFFYSNFSTLNAGDTINFGIQTPDSTRWTHLVWDIQSTLGVRFRAYESASITFNGTDQTAYNSNRNSATANNWVNFELNPTVTALGTQILAQQVGTSTNPVQGLAGNNQREDEIILKQNTVYLFRFIGLNNSTVVSYSARFYQHTNKE